MSEASFKTCDLYPGVKIYDPMLVHKCPDNVQEVLSKGRWIGSKKVDGYFELLVKEENQVYMFARSVSKKTGFFTEKSDNVPHLKKWVSENLPNGTCLIGEVYVPGGKSSDVTKFLGCLPEKAVLRQKEYGNLRFYCHDLIKYAGKDYVLDEEPYSKRYSDLCKYIDLGSPLIPEIEVAGCYDGVYIDLLQKAAQLIDDGEEGMVIRNEAGLYLPGKRRAKEMFKIKQEDSFDAIIIGFIEPEKQYKGKEEKTWKYWVDIEDHPRPSPYTTFGAEKRIAIPVTKAYMMGWKGGITIGLYSDGNIIPIGTISSGISDAMKEDMAKNPDEYLGRVVEIQAMSVDKKEHSVRHGRFVRMRPDKPATDCDMESVFS